MWLPGSLWSSIGEVGLRLVISSRRVPSEGRGVTSSEKQAVSWIVVTGERWRLLICCFLNPAISTTARVVGARWVLLEWK